MLKTRKNNKNRIFKLGFLILFLILFFGYLRFNFFAQASDERVDIYPQSFSLENKFDEPGDFPAVKDFSWQKGENSLARENDQSADFSVFSEINSAFIYFGRGEEDISTSTPENPNLPEINNNISSSTPAENNASSGDSGKPAAGSAGGQADEQIIPVENPEAPAAGSGDSENAAAESENSALSEEGGINAGSESEPIDSAPASSEANNQAPLAGSQPEIFNHLPESAPAHAESFPVQAEPAPVENVSVPEAVSAENSSAAPADSGDSESAPSTPVSFLNSLKAAGKGLGILWRSIVFTPKVNAENEAAADLSASSTADISSAEKTAKAVELKNSLVFSDFNLGSYLSDSEIVNVQLRLSLAAESNFSFDHLSVEYSLGDDWQEAGDLFLKGGTNNSANGGYFLFALPIFSSWEEIDDLKVRVSYANGEISKNDLKNKKAKVYLDGLWLEVDYNRGKVKGEKEINKEVQDEEAIPGAEQRFWSEGPLEIDGKEINFGHTDENENENLLIKSDRKDYIGLSQADVYLSITNTGGEEEKFGWQAYFPDAVGRISSLEKFSRRYEVEENPVFGVLSYFCSSTWQMASGTEKEYQCLDNEKMKFCDSLSRDKKKCRQENAVVGQAQEKKKINEWKMADVRPGKLNDKRNILEKIFGFGPKKKSVSNDLVPKASTEAEIYSIAPGETQYFRMKINFTPRSKGEFYLEAVGDKQGYGLLDPWWNASWDYQRAITVSYSGAASLSDFQVSVSLDTAALITAGKMKSDCSDIRFADSNRWSDSSELSYYLEGGTCNKTTTRLWVKVPSITAAKTIYLFYGNALAASASNGANTFVYFNDFETTVGFDTGLLNPVRSNRAGKFKNGSYGLNANASSNYYLQTRNGISSGRNLIWETWIQGESSSTVNSYAGIAVGHPNGNNVNGYQATIDTRGVGYPSLAIKKDYGTTNLAYSSVASVSSDTWYFLQLNWRSTNVLWAKLYVNSTTTTPYLTCSTTDSSYTNGEYGVGDYQIADWDDYRVRKYSSSTVSTAVGSETSITHVPANPSSLQQYKADGITALANGALTAENAVSLIATSTDKDGNSISLFYQLATTSGSFITSTTTPANACFGSTAFSGCSSRVWTNSRSGWWNASYSYRRKITFGTSHSYLYTGYTASTTMDTRIASTNVTLAAGDDVRIVWHSSTTAPVEIDRIGDTWNSATTKIEFRLQKDIAAASDESKAGAYYVYYGYSGASSPPVDMANVYYEYDPFNNSSLGSEWTTVDKDLIAGTTFTETSTLKITSGGTDVWNANDEYGAIYRSVPGSFEATTRIINQISGGTYAKAGIMVKNNLAVTAANNGFGVVCATPGGLNYVGQWDADNNGYCDSYNGAGASAYPTCVRMVKRGTIFRTYYSMDCSTFTLINSFTPGGTINTAQHVGLFSDSYIAGSLSSTYYSWIKIKLKVAIAETCSLAAEENGSINKFNLTSLPENGYKWQALACTANGCSNWTAFNASTPNFTVDATPPIFTNTFTHIASTTNSIKLGFPTAVTETNFDEYRIYYKVGSTTAIHETDYLISSSSDINLGSRTFYSESSTTITGLATGTVYSFSLWAYDQVGNKSSSTLTWERTDRAPTIVFNSAGQRVDGTGRIDISAAINDPDRDHQLMARVDYVSGAACNFSTPLDPTLDETDANTTATQGDPKVQNKNTYQIGTSTGYIVTTAGANTVDFDWLSKTDLDNQEGVYCLQVTVYDNKGATARATTTLYIDNIKPSAPGPLTLNERGDGNITANLGSAVTETVFSEYKIFYKVGVSGVTENNILFGSSTAPGDTVLASQTFLSHSTTTITGLVPATTYVFNIWAYDVYGNKASGTSEFSATTRNAPANASDLAQYRSDGATAITNNTWINENEINLYATSTDTDGDPLFIYYQLATSSGSYLTATTVPANACSSGTAYASCPSRIWYSSRAVKADIKSIPSDDYKWQALACSADGCSKNWVVFNATIPNIRIDVSAPTPPGALTLGSRTANTVNLKFGTQTTEPNFIQYKIFYKIGASGVRETDLLRSSSSDANLGYINYNSEGSTTIISLNSGTQYTFNIWAYDVYGRKASATSEFSIMTLSGSPDIGATNLKDTYLASTLPTANYGSVADIYIRRTASTAYRNTIISFTLPSAPPGSPAISSVKLFLYEYAFQGAATYEVHQLSANTDWVETQATWNIARTGINWTTAGGDYSATIIDTTTGGVTPASWKSWVLQGTGSDNPLSLNWGNTVHLLLRCGVTTLGVGATFRSKEYSDAAYRPYVEVAYKTLPAIPSGLGQYRSNGITAIANGSWVNSNTINLFATSSGADSDPITIYYQLATSSGSYITATTTPTGACSSGTAYTSCSQRVWYSSQAVKASIGSIPDNDYKWQALACDASNCSKSWTAFNATIPNIKIDATPPIFTNTFTHIASTTNTLKFGFPTAVTETNFDEYKIYYKVGSTTAIHETDYLISSSTDPNLGSRLFNNKSSTTISGLATGTVYSFSLWAYDQAGNKSSSTLTWERTDRAPTVIFNSAGQRIDGSGRIDISAAINDVDRDSQLMARVDYVAGTTCNFSTPFDPTLDETDANTTATQGDPKVQNKNTYQVGTSTGYIITTSGSNTVSFDWFSRTDLNDLEGVYCVKITVNDNKGATAWATTTLYIDNKIPTSPGPLTFNKNSGISITPNLGSATTETNFSEYKIFYKTGVSGVAESNTLFGSSTAPGDAALASQTFSSHSTTTITGLISSTVYVFNIWAYDLYGNKASGTSEFSASTRGIPVNASSLAQYRADGSTALVNNIWINESEVNFYATSTDADTDPVTIYYQLATTSGTYLAATTTPGSACSSGTAYASCPSRVWYSSKSTKADIKNIPDGQYKWQALACAYDGCSRNWVVFNAATPNIKIDATAPTAPGSLTFGWRTTNSINVKFGGQTTETNFAEYKIFYKTGSANVRETDSLWGSSSAASLGVITFSGKSSTTITGLTANDQYFFNIWAYDVYGNKASATLELAVSAGSYPTSPFNLQQYRTGTTVLPNGAWAASSSVVLTATSSSNGLLFSMYYELIGDGSTFTAATTTPSGACSPITPFGSCTGNIWKNSSSTSAWYDRDFLYRAKITAKNSKVNADLASFPVYFDLARLGTTHSFWPHTQKNSLGGDLLMVDSTGARIPLQIVSVSTSSKTGEIYFRASNIYDLTDTEFYLYYGSSTASQPAAAAAYGSQSVWSNYYNVVYHLQETSGQKQDSTSNARNSTAVDLTTQGSAAGKIGGADYYTRANTNSITLPTTILTAASGTIGIWAKETNFSASARSLLFQHRNGTNNNRFYLDELSTVYNTSFGSNDDYSSGYTIPSGEWHRYLLTWDNLSWESYVDDTRKASGSVTSFSGAMTNSYLGSFGGTQQYFEGYLDEFSVSSVQRSKQWIQTEFNNQNNPGTFFSTSSEQSTVQQRTITVTGIPDSAIGYKWQALSCNDVYCSRAWTKFNLTTPNFKVDTTAPTAPGALSMISRRVNSITLGFGSQTTETNFSQYKIFYKIGTIGVRETDTLWGSSSEAALSYKNYNNATSTTIEGLAANTYYVFNIWAYDLAGRKASSTAVSFQTANSVAEVYDYVSGSNSGWIDAPFAWDSTNNTYAYRSIPGSSVNDSANYLLGMVNNSPTSTKKILSVELGIEGYTNDQNNVDFKIIPFFNSTTPGATSTLSGALFGQADSNNTYYVDITNDSWAPASWTWNDIVNLDAKVFAVNSSSTAVTAYVDQIRLRASVDAYPDAISGLGQYKSDKLTAIANDSWLKERNIMLKGQATDPDTIESLALYFQFIPTAQSFAASTTEPAGACVSGTAYGSCGSKIWLISYTGAPADFSIDPFIGTTSLTDISDGSYKWQGLACDSSGICSSWGKFNLTTPNINVDATNPAVPGNLTYVSKTSGSVTLRFGATTTDDNFYRYRIFYVKSSTTPVTEAGYEQSDTNLNFLEYNGAATTTVAGLAKNSWYTFNIWAYDLAGNKASATTAVVVKTNSGYILGQTSYLIENDDGAGVNLNTAPGLAGVALSNVEKGQRINTRIQIQNTGADQTYNKRFKLQFENNTDAPGLWYDVGGATAISYSYGLSGANGDPITAVKAASNGNTWADGTWHEYANLTNMYNLNLSRYTEFVFAIQTANATAGKTYRLRLIDGTGSSTFDTYTVYPTLNMISSDTKKYSKTNSASLPSASSDLDYFLDVPGYTALSSDNASYDSIAASAGQYPVFDFAIKYSKTNNKITGSWNGQSSVAPSANKITLQAYRFGSTNAWAVIASNTSAAADTDFTLSGTIDNHIADYYSGGYAYYRVYQAAGSETLRSDYFSFSTSTAFPLVTGKHYKWRNDDALFGLWREEEDTGDPTLGTAIAKNVHIRLRLSFNNSKAGSATSYGFGLQYATTTSNCSSGSFGSWRNLTTSAAAGNHFAMVPSSYFTNGDITTSQLSSDSYTYTSGYLVSSPGATSSAITLIEDRYTEVEFDFEATSSAVSGGTYCFRGTNDGAALDAYDRYAELTIAGTPNTAPSFSKTPSDNGSDASAPTVYGQSVTFTATATDPEIDEYYLAVCKTNVIVTGNGAPPACSGGSWCISPLASSSVQTSCSYNTAHDPSSSHDWYAYVCDLRYGSGVSKCSAVSQGAGGSPNASPFYINHPPYFTAISTLNDYQNPGGLFNIQATVADSDSGNTLNYYVCRANSASSTGCNGGAANIVCSETATTTNPICHYQNTAPSLGGAFTYYAFVYDNFGLMATSSPRSSSYHINNVITDIGSTVLNNGSDIILNIKGAADKEVELVSTSVVDQNGCQSLVSATAVIYRTGIDYSCSANDNNCYQITTSNCIKSDCSGSTDAIATYTCTTSLKFFAEPTAVISGNPWTSDDWSGRLQVYDGSNYIATTAPAVEVRVNSALDIIEDTINFGNLNPGQNTNTNTRSVQVVNYGNSPINSDLSGSDLFSQPSGAIAVSYIKWDLTEFFAYPSAGTNLLHTDALVNLVMPKPTSTVNVIDLIYWGIGIPATSTRTTFTGTSTFSAVLDSSGW